MTLNLPQQTYTTYCQPLLFVITIPSLPTEGKECGIFLPQNPQVLYLLLKPNPQISFAKYPQFSIYFCTQYVMKQCVSFLLLSKSKLPQSYQLKNTKFVFLMLLFHWVRNTGSLLESPAQSSQSCFQDVSQSEFLIEAENPLASSCCSWQNSVPCSCRFHGALLL